MPNNPYEQAPLPLDHAHRQPPPDWLVENFLRRKTLTMLAASPHSMKTMLLLNLMLSCEHGQKYLGRYNIPDQAATLFIEQDAPEWDLDTQITKLALGLGITDEELAPERTASRKLVCRGMKLLHPQFVPYVLGLREQLGFSNLFIDTIRRFMDGDENDSQIVSLHMEKLEQLRDEGLAVIFAHHTGKPTPEIRRTYRGSEAIQGSVDYHIFLERKTTGNIHMLWEKGRGHGQSEEVIIEAEDTPEGGLVLRAVQEGQQSDILTALASGGKTRKELMNIVKQVWQIEDTAILYKRLDNNLQALRRQRRVVGRDGKWELQ